MIARLCVAAALALALPASGQVEGQPPSALPADMHTQHPGLVLGWRSRQVQSAQAAAPVVVLVPDTGSFAAAVAAWDGHRRYPVLIDDGSDKARDAVGRFVRAYGPESVVRWSGGESAAWPEEQGQREDRLVAAWIDAMAAGERVTTAPEALALMKASGYTPAGVVVVDTADPAWVAGLALAAGRLCPMVFVDAPTRGGIDAHLTHEQADALASAIEAGVDRLGVEWRGLGDGLDAVALAANTPVRIRVEQGGKRQHLAVTDRIGRHNSRGVGTRWAWCGQVHGDSVDAAYRAMCSLFLSPAKAWVFDGYPGTREWSAFDGSEAASALIGAGLEVGLHDVPANSPAHWSSAAAQGIDAGVVLVNTKGQATAFELPGGALHAGDAPLLGVPCLLHMVHSFAFERPGNAFTVGGRWLAHGAWGAAGSVDEPYLHGFVPTPVVARRLAAGMAWGAVPRHDTGALWKIAVLGDPLFTLGPAGAPREGGVALEGAQDIAQERAAAVRERRFGEALRLLVLAGKDEDAARLAAALLGEAPDEVTPDAAAHAVGPLFRAGRHAAAIDAFARLDPQRQREPRYADALWHAARAGIGRAGERSVIDLLDKHLRDGQQVYDAIEIATRLQRLEGAEAAASYLRHAQGRMSSERSRGEIDKAIERMTRRRP